MIMMMIMTFHSGWLWAPGMMAALMARGSGPGGASQCKPLEAPLTHWTH